MPNQTSNFGNKTAKIEGIVWWQEAEVGDEYISNPVAKIKTKDFK